MYLVEAIPGPLEGQAISRKITHNFASQPQHSYSTDSILVLQRKLPLSSSTMGKHLLKNTYAITFRQALLAAAGRNPLSDDVQKSLLDTDNGVVRVCVRPVLPVTMLPALFSVSLEPFQDPRLH
ncbi:MAG: hypothetical protein Q9157_000111 [Trypethelium eluteriae]